MSSDRKIVLRERHLCGAEVLRLVFERPDGYEYRAGQWLRLTLATAEGEQTRTLSHASAPADGVLEVATRLSASEYKRALAALEPGAEVRIAGPGGRFLLPDSVRRAVFLVGGIGITPIRSMLRDRRARALPFDDALLVYGNRDDTCELFLGELESLSDLGVRMVRVLERPPAGWDGEQGLITAQTVSRYLESPSGYRFVTAGPPAMSEAMKRVMDDLAVPQDERLLESFGVSAG